MVQVSGVWQDDLRFKSRSSDPTLGVSRLSNARFLPGGGGQDVDVNLSGLSPGTLWIDVDVRDLRETATDTIRIGPFTVLAAPTITATSLTVSEDLGPALVTFTLSAPAPQRLTGAAGSPAARRVGH